MCETLNAWVGNFKSTMWCLFIHVVTTMGFKKVCQTGLPIVSFLFLLSKALLLLSSALIDNQNQQQCRINIYNQNWQRCYHRQMTIKTGVSFEHVMMPFSTFTLRCHHQQMTIGTHVSLEHVAMPSLTYDNQNMQRCSINIYIQKGLELVAMILQTFAHCLEPPKRQSCAQVILWSSL